MHAKFFLHVPLPLILKLSVNVNIMQCYFTDEDIDPLETLLIPRVSGSTVTVYVDSPLADYVRVILSGDSGHRGVYRSEYNIIIVLYMHVHA